MSLAENSAGGTLVATLAATNVSGSSVTYSITSNVDPDNDGTAAFLILDDGLLVNDVDDLDYEGLAQLQVTVHAFDGVTASPSLITVDLTNVIELPIVADDTYRVMTNGSLTVDAPGLLANDTVIESDALTAFFPDVNRNTAPCRGLPMAPSPISPIPALRASTPLPTGQMTGSTIRVMSPP